MGTKSVDVKGESITEYVTCQGVHYKEMSSIYLESGYDFIRDYPMMKLGCARLVHTFSFTQGGLSQRQMICHVNQLGTVPNFNLWLSSCILGEHGLRAIEHNMDNLFGNPEFTRFFPSDGKWMATLIIDGVALDEKFNLDDSQIPHQITGGCRHCIDTTFNTFEDAQRFQEGLESGIPLRWRFSQLDLTIPPLHLLFMCASHVRAKPMTLLVSLRILSMRLCQLLKGNGTALPLLISSRCLHTILMEHRNFVKEWGKF